MRAAEIFPGVRLHFLALPDDASPRYAAGELAVLYCRAERVGWKTAAGSSVNLGPGDFCVCPGELLADAEFYFPNDRCELLRIELEDGAEPELIADSGVTPKRLKDRLCGAGCFPHTGSEQTESIFSAFYDQPAELRNAYLRIKTLELLLYLAKLEPSGRNQMTQYQAEQVRVIRDIHDLLASNMERRFTIEELSHKYLMNPTTLKAVFKSVYGESIAAHMKEHRMKKAAALLHESDMSIAEIGRLVGYESQSKFTAAFKESYGCLPKEYRKKV